MTTKLLGLDIGTTKICGLLLDADSGEVVKSVVLPNDARVSGSEPWEVLQDPDAILGKARSIVDSFLDHYIGVEAIGVTGQMHGILYVDREGRARGPLMTWQDTRGGLICEGGRTFASMVAAATGLPASAGMGSVTHLFNVRAGAVPEGAASLCTIMDYVAMRLGGARSPIMDGSNAAGLGGFDARSMQFMDSGLESLGVDPAIFPEVDSSYPAVGSARPGTRVFVALGDNQASFLGSVSDVRRSALVNLGTGGQISFPLGEYTEIQGLDMRLFPFGGFLAVGASLCGGKAYLVLRDFFTATLRMFIGGDFEADWRIMDSVDESMLRGEALVADTRFAGSRSAPEARGRVDRIGSENFTPEHLIAAFRVGIATELFDFFRLLPEDIRSSLSQLSGAGNCIRRNPSFRRVFEDLFGMPMRVPEHREEAAFGAALLAGLASGTLPDLPSASALIRY